MAKMHIKTLVHMNHEQSKARELCTADSYADYAHKSVVFTPDNNPGLVDRLGRVLQSRGLTYNRLVYGGSSAGCGLVDVLFGPSPVDGNHAVGLAIMESRIPMGD